MKRFHFNKNYFLIAMSLFVLGVLIVLFPQVRFIRNHVGDFLVVIFMYSLFKSFFNTPYLKTALGVLIIAYSTEALQYLGVLSYLNWQDSQVAQLAFGHRFDGWDMLAYTLGFLTIIAVEKILSKKSL